MTPGALQQGAGPGACSPEHFFELAHRTFERAAAAAGERSYSLSLAGATVRMRFAGEALVPRLMPALQHRIDATARAVGDLEVCIFDTTTTGVQMPPPAWGPDAYGPKGEIVGFNTDRIRTVFQPGVDILHLFDRERSLAVYWVADPEHVPWWESSFPLRTILHWWTVPTSLQPAHSGAVGVQGRGVLVAGNSGAGKSTSTLACLRGGMQYVGDDYVLIDVDRPAVHSLYSTAKLEPHNTARFPELEPLISNPDALDRQKALLYLADHRPDQLAHELEVVAIVLPRVSGLPDTTLHPTSAAAALSVLAPTTSFHLPGNGPEVFHKLNRLVRSLPCYTLAAGTDLAQIPERLTGLIGELAGQ